VVPAGPPGVVRAALRKPAFWIIAGGFTAVYLNHGILLTYALVLFADRGRRRALPRWRRPASDPRRWRGG
jgi:hypothetical protein